MSEEAVTIKVTLSADDYIAIQKQSVMKISIVSCVFFCILIFGALFRNIGEINRVSVFALIFTNVALWICLLMIVPSKLKKQWTQQYNSNKLLSREQTFVIEKDGLKRFSDTETSCFTWSDLHAYSESALGFLIYVSETNAYFIPKRVIDGDKVGVVRSYLSSLQVYKKKSVVPKGVVVYLVLFVVVILFVLFLRYFRS